MNTEIDKSRSSKRGISGGSIFSSNPNAVPSELAPLVAPQQTLSKLVLSTKTSVNGASQDYDKLMDPSAVVPSPPVHAARLNGLLKTLANAEGAVAESIKARRVLIEGLQKILDANRIALSAEETQLSQLSSRKTEIDAKKRDVEESIMRGFASNDSPGSPAGEGSPGTHHSPVTPAPEPDRPEVEALTPPGYPKPQAPEPVPDYNLEPSNGGDQYNNGSHNVQSYQQQPHADVSNVLSALSGSYARPGSATSGGSVKKRKLNDDFPDLGGDAMDGLDADVAEILRRDSGNGF